MVDDPGMEFGATIRSFGAGMRVFDRFLLERMLGRGGMGVVWLAKDESLGVNVALKFLPEMVGLDEGAVADLARETLRARQLAHHHILRVYDFHRDRSLAAISMEWVDGPTLTSLRVKQSGQVFEPEQLEPWLRQLAEALDYAHQRAQVVHRDLKPSNLMIDSRNELKVADFGISASISESVTRVSRVASSSGSPPYMSPQQMYGEKASPYDDVYSVGATLYELLTGKPPFYSGNLVMQVQSKVPPSIAERRLELGVQGQPIAGSWENAIAACLSKEEEPRPKSVGELVERIQSGPPGGNIEMEHPASPPPLPPRVSRPEVVGAGVDEGAEHSRGDAVSTPSPPQLPAVASASGAPGAGKRPRPTWPRVIFGLALFIGYGVMLLLFNPAIRVISFDVFPVLHWSTVGGVLVAAVGRFFTAPQSVSPQAGRRVSRPMIRVFACIEVLLAVGLVIPWLTGEYWEFAHRMLAAVIVLYVPTMFFYIIKPVTFWRRTPVFVALSSALMLASFVWDMIWY